MVEEYKYLGMKITPELSETVMREARLETAKMLIGKEQGFLCD